MVNKKQTAMVATLLIVAVAAIASVAIYIMANQTPNQTDQTLTQGENPPSGMPGLETRPENQDDGPEGPQL
jgi:hypothetical protein